MLSGEKKTAMLQVRFLSLHSEPRIESCESGGWHVYDLHEKRGQQIYGITWSISSIRCTSVSSIPEKNITIQPVAEHSYAPFGMMLAHCLGRRVARSEVCLKRCPRELHGL